MSPTSRITYSSTLELMSDWASFLVNQPPFFTSKHLLKYELKTKKSI